MQRREGEEKKKQEREKDKRLCTSERERPSFL